MCAAQLAVHQLKPLRFLHPFKKQFYVPCKPLVEVSCMHSEKQKNLIHQVFIIHINKFHSQATFDLWYANAFNIQESNLSFLFQKTQKLENQSSGL